MNQIPYRIKTLTPPTDKPVSVAELRVELAISHSDLDTALEDLISEATEHIAAATGLVAIDTTFIEYFDHWPVTSTHWGELHRAPVDSVTSIKYTDTDDAEQTWSSANYIVDVISQPARIGIATAGTIPGHINEINAVWIEYVAGFGAASDVPAIYKEFVRLYCRPRYERRAPTAAEDTRERAIISELMYML